MQPDYTVLNIMDQAADSEVQQMNIEAVLNKVHKNILYSCWKKKKSRKF